MSKIYPYNEADNMEKKTLTYPTVGSDRFVKTAPTAKVFLQILNSESASGRYSKYLPKLVHSTSK